MTTTVTTNGHARPLILVTYDEAEGYRELLPGEEIDTSSQGFRYHGDTYSLNEFESIARGISIPVAAPTPDDRDHLAEWHGVQPQSAYSAVVVRYTDDYESVVVGYMTW